MKVALVSSRQDRAGTNIRHHIEGLLSNGAGELPQTGRTYEFIETDGRLIHAEGIDAGCDAGLTIFLSRHASVNPVPVLTVHVTGNFGNAELGGAERTLAPAATAMMHATLRSLARHCPEGYRVSYEVTHHGPTAIVRPSFFVEIGSTEKERELRPRTHARQGVRAIARIRPGIHLSSSASFRGEPSEPASHRP